MRMENEIVFNDDDNVFHHSLLFFRTNYSLSLEMNVVFEYYFEMDFQCSRHYDVYLLAGSKMIPINVKNAITC